MRHRQHRRHSSGAFTLLEVLVVVAVIALLVAILIPSLARARRQARQLVCQTNLRTIAQAWHLYLADSNGKFLKSGPGLDNVQINFGGKQGQLDAFKGDKPLNRYVGPPLNTSTGTKVFFCPFDVGSGRAQPTYFDYQGNSYLMNHFLVGPPGPPGLQAKPGDPDWVEPMLEKLAGLDVAEVRNLSRLLLVGDLGWYNAWESTFGEEDHIDWHEPPGRHNIAFLDGHVAFIEIQKGQYSTASYTLIPFKKQ